jgi:hypothetical protein
MTQCPATLPGPRHASIRLEAIDFQLGIIPFQNSRHFSQTPGLALQPSPQARLPPDLGSEI